MAFVADTPRSNVPQREFSWDTTGGFGAGGGGDFDAEALVPSGIDADAAELGLVSG
jgi:hypothetical protein